MSNELKQCFQDDESIELGIDEVGRGCLAGPVCVAACIWPHTEDPILQKKFRICDSKKLSKKKRKESCEYIKNTAIAYSIQWGDNDMIDKYNILETTKQIMHKCIDDIIKQLKGKNLKLNRILVDGPHFEPYLDDDFECIPFECIIKGDNVYKSIAAYSILAKETRDKYMEDITLKNPEIYGKYGWKNNKAYGTTQHIDAIKQYGITQLHRKTFGICKNYT